MRNTAIESAASQPVPVVQGTHARDLGIDVTRTDLQSGALRKNGGKTEWYSDQFIIHSEDRQAGFAISDRMVNDFRATSEVRILGGQIDTSWAGLMYDPYGVGGGSDGAVFFGKNHHTVKILHVVKGKLVSALREELRAKPRRADIFELFRLNGRYRFILNGEEVATLLCPAVKGGLVEIVAGKYSIGAFKNWKVSTQGS